MQIHLTFNAGHVAPKKLIAEFADIVECSAVEDRLSNGAYCPLESVVLGDVIDIGEAYRQSQAAGALSRLRE